MSNDRIAARAQYNQSIKADTAAKRSQARRIESQMNQ